MGSPESPNLPFPSLESADAGYSESVDSSAPGATWQPHGATTAVTGPLVDVIVAGLRS